MESHFGGVRGAWPRVVEDQDAVGACLRVAKETLET